MTNKDAVHNLLKRKKCINQTRCDKQCFFCDHYVKESDEKEAIDLAVKALLSQRQVKIEFFKSGIEYAKTEFIRLLEKEKLNVGELHKSKVIDDLTFTQVLGLQKAIELTDEVKMNGQD